VDLGCGSGFIACGLAKKGILTFATDINPACRELVANNAQRNGLAIKYLPGHPADIMAAIPHEEQINLVVANLPFCRADLLGSLEGTSYYYWFAAKEGFLKKCAEQVLNRLSAQGRFIFCYASSGWIDELEEVTNRTDVRTTLHTDEITESRSERRWIVELRKL